MLTCMSWRRSASRRTASSTRRRRCRASRPASTSRSLVTNAVGHVEPVDPLVGLADPVERRGRRRRSLRSVQAHPAAGRRSRPGSSSCVLALDGQPQRARRRTNSTASAAGSASGRSEPPPGATSTTYWLNVSANPGQRPRQHPQPGLGPSTAGSWRRCRSCVPRGITAYASVNRARSVVSAVWRRQAARRHVVVAHRRSSPPAVVLGGSPSGRRVRRAARSRRTTPASRRPAYAETGLRWCSARRRRR